VRRRPPPLSRCPGRSLVTLRKLAAKNDPSERRKVAGPIQRLTDAERDWITAALPRITRQVAEIEAASSAPKLNLGPPEGTASDLVVVGTERAVGRAGKTARELLDRCP
jgi:hypothetical protein